MIFKEDNFLPIDVLDKLSDKTAYLYKLAKVETSFLNIAAPVIDEDIGVYDIKQSMQFCKRFRFFCNGDDVMKETVDFFGEDIEKVILCTKQYIIDQGWKDIKLSNVWFQYGDTESLMHRHADGQIRGVEYQNCLTSMIFCHKKWDDDCGGIFRAVDGDTTKSFGPTPNRLVVWNRNHAHWMTPIVKECPLRMFIGMSWYAK